MFTVMQLKLDSAPTSVVGMTIMAAASMHGLEFHLLDVPASHNLFHQMEMHQFMQLSV
jgi:hypothetical protein